MPGPPGRRSRGNGREAGPGAGGGHPPWRAKNSPGKRGGGPDHGAEQATGTERLIVDSVYAKALALAQRPVGGQTVVFWHTGGVLVAVAAPGEAHK